MSSSNDEKVMATIKFLPFSSTVDSPFWVQYNHLKLETIKLSEDPIPITASYGAGECRLQCTETSLNVNEPISNDRIVIPGKLVGLNTLEAFQKIDKNLFISNHLDNNKDELLNFVLLTFNDLKNHKVLYWFGIPALMNSSPIQAELLANEDASSCMSKVPQAFHQLRKDNFEKNKTGGTPAFFVMNKETMEMKVVSKACLEGAGWDIENLVFGFVDSAAAPAPTATTASSNSNSIIMGWPLRTMLAYLSLQLQLGGKAVTVVSYRPSRLRRILKEGDGITSLPDTDSSIVMKITVPNDYGDKVVGWELNARSKPGPRWCNLRPLLDQNHLAIQAADLNLKLMKWRMLPDLDVEKLQSTKCLLLGAGTLGCSVARTLLGWGIRNFKILDYGTVSYSNPVRQNLFTLEDCHFNNGGGKDKAQAAVDSLKHIAADVHAEAIKLSIPMPGHPSETLESIQNSVSVLDNLIKDADIVFLLTDTRESRWLPTLMAAAHDKLLINAALGLDSWLVMRHGGGVSSSDDESGSDRLGCYFCNDIVAPENSTKNRTLDQQCTVTRPGLAPIASSMAVELMVSTLHHPKCQHAPAPKPTAGNKAFSPTAASEDTSSPLGIMPHQIRGSLVSYTMMTPTVPAFKCCTACCPAIIDAYKEDKVDLVFQACQNKDGSFLEQISGLTEFRAEAAEKLADMDDMDWDDDEDE